MRTTASRRHRSSDSSRPYGVARQDSTPPLPVRPVREQLVTSTNRWPERRWKTGASRETERLREVVLSAARSRSEARMHDGAAVEVDSAVAACRHVQRSPGPGIGVAPIGAFPNCQGRSETFQRALFEAFRASRNQWLTMIPESRQGFFRDSLARYESPFLGGVSNATKNSVYSARMSWCASATQPSPAGGLLRQRESLTIPFQC